MAEPTPPQVPAGFQKLVKEQMEKLNLTLRDVEKLADISPAYLSRLLNGQRGLPPDATLQRLAKALRIRPQDMLVQAERSPADIKRILKRKDFPAYLRTLAELTVEDLQKVMNVADELRDEHERKHGKTAK